MLPVILLIFLRYFTGNMTRWLPPELMILIFEFILHVMKVPIWTLILVNRHWRDIIYNRPLFWSRFSVVGRISSLPDRLLEVGLYPRVISTASLDHVISRIGNYSIYLTILLEYGPYIGVPGLKFYGVLHDLLHNSSRQIAELTIRILQDPSQSTPNLPRNPTTIRKNLACHDTLANTQESSINHSLLYIFGHAIPKVTRLVIDDPGSVYAQVNTYVLLPQTQVTHLEFLDRRPFDVSWLAKVPQLNTCVLYHLSKDGDTEPFVLLHLRTLVITTSAFNTIAILRAPRLERLLLDKENRITQKIASPAIHFPALHSLRVSRLRGRFVPNFPLLENVHLGVSYIEESWLQRLLVTTSGISPLKRLRLDVQWPADIGSLFSFLSSIPQVQTLQIDTTNHPHNSDCTEKVLRALRSNIFPALRCLQLSFLDHVEGLAGYVEDVKRAQPMLQGFTYHRGENSDDSCVVLKCTNEENGCCEVLKQVFNEPVYAFCEMEYQD
jgi:hypothetical protein